MEHKGQKGNHLDNWTSTAFKVGMAISLTLVIIGLILISITGTEVKPVVPLSQLPQRIMELNATAIITLGILVLLFTPILQVAVALVTFSIGRDKLHLGVCIALMCIIAFSLALALV